MANKKQIPIQVGFEHCDEKIDRKVDKETFHWVTGIIITIIIAMIGAAFYFVFKYSDSLIEISGKVIRLETKLDDMKSH